MADLGGLGGLGTYGGYLAAEDAGATARAKKYAVDQAQQGDIAFGRTLQLLSGGQGQGMPQQGMPPGPPGMSPQGMPPGMPPQPMASPPMGGPGAVPPMPLQPPQPMGGQQAGAAPPPMGGPPMQQPRPPMPPSQMGMPQGGMPPPQGQPGMQPPQPPQGLPQQGGPGLDWRMVLQKTIQANPGAPPQVLAAAVDRWLPLMNQQSQQVWKEQSLFLKEQQNFDRSRSLDDRERALRDQEAYRWARGYGQGQGGGPGGGASGNSGGPDTDPIKQQAIQVYGPNVVANGDGIRDRTLPPTMQGMYGMQVPLKTYLQDKRYGQPFDLAKAQQEWQAQTKLISTMNGPQQVRFRQLVATVAPGIDELRELSTEMKMSGVALWNEAKIAYELKYNANSPESRLYSRYQTAFAAIRGEVSQYENGGYAPTDASWKAAYDQLDTARGFQAQMASLDEVNKILQYRLQGMNSVGGLPPGSANPYAPNQGAAGQQTGGAGAATSPAGQVQQRFRYDSNGNPIGQ